MATIGILLLMTGLTGRGVFVSDDVGRKALDDQGYRNIRITDKAFVLIGYRGCDGADAARFTAVATNSNGKDVTLYVCAGWPFKGATIRNP